MTDTQANHSTRKMQLGIFFLTLIVFLPVIFFRFLYVDDDEYVYENIYIASQTLNLDFIQWAFLKYFSLNWHPITWLSHKIDFLIYGFHPGGHHLTSALIHSFNAAFLFAVLKRVIPSIRLCLFTVLIFALHPTRIESVAWISERKDVLSTLFFFGTLYTYFIYAQTKERIYYAGSVLAFAFCLMTKGTYVTAAFALVLLDFWPLNRLSKKNLKMIVLEKIPYLILAIITCWIIFQAQRPDLDEYALSIRISNAIVSYIKYIGLFFWPHPVSFYHPFKPDIHSLSIIGSVLLIFGATLWGWFQRNKYPAFLTGWLLFVGMLFPVIGVIKIGDHSITNRYLYFPIITLSFMCYPLLQFLNHKYAFNSKVKTGLLILLAGAMSLGTSLELPYWQNSSKLFQRAVEIEPENWLMHRQLRSTYGREGDHKKAAYHLIRAFEIAPQKTHAKIYINMRDFYFMSQYYLSAGKYKLAASSMQQATERLVMDIKNQRAGSFTPEEIQKLLLHFQTCTLELAAEKPLKRCVDTVKTGEVEDILTEGFEFKNPLKEETQT